MAVEFKLRGLPKVLANLNKELKGIENKSVKGLIRASTIVRRSMEKEAPKTPVDTGNLRSSYFTVTSKGGVAKGRSPKFKGKNKGKLSTRHPQVLDKYKAAIEGKEPSIIMGYTANYALFVHEDIGATFRRPGAGAKFFEAALDRNEKKILEVIAKEAKIK